MMPTSADPLDQRLTALLIQNARESVANLARQLGTAAGVPQLQAYVGISVAPKAGREVVRELQRMPEVRQLSAVSGDNDYVYLIDPYRLSHYRAGLGRRAKTDAQEAQLLARFLEREMGELRPWEPMMPGQQRFWQLLKRRAALVQQCEQMIRKLGRALLKHAQELGWAEWIERCQAVPGVGRLTAMALVASWQRGQFRSVDAFVAFLGLDVRVKQSGRWQGRRSAQWAPYYLRLRERGMSSTAALVALSRKLAKVSFALLRTDARFVPAEPERACAAT